MPFYFQSVMRAPIALGLSLGRGLVVSGGLILLLPAVVAPAALWWAMPVTELALAVGAWILLARSRRTLREG